MEHLPSPVSWRKAILHIAQNQSKPNLSFCISCDLEIHSVGGWEMLIPCAAKPGGCPWSQRNGIETNLTAGLSTHGDDPKEQWERCGYPEWAVRLRKSPNWWLNWWLFKYLQMVSSHWIPPPTWLSVLKQEVDTSNRSAPLKSHDTFRWQYQHGQNGLKLSAATTQYPSAQCFHIRVI